MGKEKRKAAMDGRMEIGFSAPSITLVDMVVFVPILFLQVFVADILKQFSVVVITLLAGFTLTPWLASRIGKKEDMQPSNFFNRFLLWFEKHLNRFVNWYGLKLNWTKVERKNCRLYFSAANGIPAQRFGFTQL